MSTSAPALRLTPFAYGFRPFFLLAGVAAVAELPPWLHVVAGGGWPAWMPAAPLWHAHEMLFGLVTAAVAGFLLTAVPNWTGRRGYAGRPLVALTLLWVAGRVCVALYGLLPAGAAAAVDLAFLPALALLLAPALVRGGRRNLMFLPLLGVLFTANLLMHLQLAGAAATARTGELLAVDTYLLMISVIGGRIVPAFTLNALRRRDPAAAMPGRGPLDAAAIGVLALMLAADAARPSSAAAGGLALLAAGLHGARLARWQGLRVLREPIVWVLHLAYGWLVAGLLLKGLAALTGAAGLAGWLHALTVGTIATMILGVMTRAALGHTARPLRAAPAVAVAYGLVGAAALLRAAGPALPDSGWYTASVLAAGACWLLAFALYLWVYAPILMRPRADGKPG